MQNSQDTEYAPQNRKSLFLVFSSNSKRFQHGQSHFGSKKHPAAAVRQPAMADGMLRSPTFLVGAERQRKNLDEFKRREQQLAEAYHKNKPLCFNACSYQKTHPVKAQKGHKDRQNGSGLTCCIFGEGIATKPGLHFSSSPLARRTRMLV